MSLTESNVFECPYCMTINDIEVDPSYDIDQTQVVDCQICCQPIEVFITDSEYGIQIRAEREND